MPVPIIAAAIGAAGSIGGALLGAHAASSAADAQVNAANIAAQTQLHMYDQTRSDLMPWMNTGGAANTALAGLYGLGPGGNGVPNASALTTALTNFPGYQFGLNQGQTALDRSAASRGLVLSGAQLKDSQQFGQGYAMQNAWQPYISQLNLMSNQGQNSAAKVGDIGGNAAQGIASAQLSAGNAQANGQLASGIGYAQALSSAAGQIGSYLTNGSLGGGGGGYVTGLPTTPVGTTDVPY